MAVIAEHTISQLKNHKAYWSSLVLRKTKRHRRRTGTDDVLGSAGQQTMDDKEGI